MTPAHFSDLETILISFCSVVVACACLFFAMGRVYPTRKECEIRHANNSVQQSIKMIERSQRLQFEMLRAVIINMDLPKAEQERIINMKVEG